MVYSLYCHKGIGVAARKEIYIARLGTTNAQEGLKPTAQTISVEVMSLKQMRSWTYKKESMILSILYRDARSFNEWIPLPFESHAIKSYIWCLLTDSLFELRFDGSLATSWCFDFLPFVSMWGVTIVALAYRNWASLMESWCNFESWYRCWVDGSLATSWRFDFFPLSRCEEWQSLHWHTVTEFPWWRLSAGTVAGPSPTCFAARIASFLANSLSIRSATDSSSRAGMSCL